MVEIGCVEVLTALKYDDSILKGSLMQLGVVGFVVRSLMRAKVTPGSKVTDPSKGQGRQEHRDFLVAKLVKACLKFLIRYNNLYILYSMCRKPVSIIYANNSYLKFKVCHLCHL